MHGSPLTVLEPSTALALQTDAVGLLGKKVHLHPSIDFPSTGVSEMPIFTRIRPRRHSPFLPSFLRPFFTHSLGGRRVLFPRLSSSCLETRDLVGVKLIPLNNITMDRSESGILPLVTTTRPLKVLVCLKWWDFRSQVQRLNCIYTVFPNSFSPPPTRRYHVISHTETDRRCCRVIISSFPESPTATGAE